MRKKILFRADGNSTTGLGHMYRLFALVEMYRDDYDFVFVTKASSSLKVIPENYTIELIPNNISVANEPKWLSEKFNSLAYIIIADGYQFVSSYQKKIKDEGFFLMYIDDLTIEHMYADVVINHSLNIKKEDYKSETYTKFAFGIDYAMLRPKFIEATKKQRKINKIDTAFVCFGGADFYDLTSKTVRALLEFEKIKEIHVVLGSAYTFDEIFSIEKNNPKVNIYKNLGECSLHDLIEKSNFAIAPSSTISYELCSVGIPLLSGYYIDNQLNIYKGLLDEEAIFDAGNFKDYSEEDFSREIENTINKSIVKHQNLVQKQKKIFYKNHKKNFLSILD